MDKYSKNLAVIIFMVSCLSFNVAAQYAIPKKELCEQLKSKILLVEIKDVSDTSVNGESEVLKRSFKDYWTLTSVEFLPTEDFNKALASSDNKYAALLAYDDESTRSVKHYSHKRTQVLNAGTSPATMGANYQTDPIGTYSGETKFYFSHFNLSISLMNGAEAKTQVCTISFANDNLVTADLQFTVQQMARLINASLNDIKGPNYYDHKKNIEFVKTKTLLIPREVFKEKDLLKIQEAYEFPHKIVSLNEMNDLILAKDDQYIYPKIIWSIQHKAYGWITVSPKVGNITSFMAFGGVHVNTHQEADDVIKVKDLKYIASGMAQGINNKYK